MPKTKQGGSDRSNGSPTKSSTDDKRSGSSSRSTGSTGNHGSQGQKGKEDMGKGSSGHRKGMDSDNRSGSEDEE